MNNKFKIQIIDNFMPESFSVGMYTEAFYGNWNMSGKTSGIPNSSFDALSWGSYPDRNPTNIYGPEFEKKLKNTINNSNIINNVEDYFLRQWFTGMTVGMYTGIHADTWANDSISSVFYLHSMAHEEGGANIFYDIDGKILHKQQPKAGTLILFNGRLGHESIPPSFLYHNRLRIVLNTLIHNPDMNKFNN